MVSYALGGRSLRDINAKTKVLKYGIKAGKIETIL